MRYSDSFAILYITSVSFMRFQINLMPKIRLLTGEMIFFIELTGKKMASEVNDLLREQIIDAFFFNSTVKNLY